MSVDAHDRYKKKDTKRTFLDQISGLSNSGNINGAKDTRKLSSVVSTTEVLLKVRRHLFVPNGGRDGDGDGRTDRRPKVKNSGSDSHVLVRDGALDTNV